jgi:hypothetical protein
MRSIRLDEQLEWLFDAPLEPSFKVEALMNEVSAFMEEGPPQGEVEEQLLLEARVLLTLCLAPLTPRLRRYLHDRLR